MNALKTYIREIIRETRDSSDANPLVRATLPISPGSLKLIQQTIVDRDKLNDDEINALDAAGGLGDAAAEGSIFTDVEAALSKVGSFGTGGPGFAGIVDEGDVRDRAKQLYTLLKADAQAASTQSGAAGSSSEGAQETTYNPNTKYNYPWRAALFIIGYQQGTRLSPLQLYNDIYGNATQQIEQNVQQLEREAADFAADRGVDVQRESKHTRRVINEGWGAVALHGIVYTIYRALIRRPVTARALRAFLQDDELWKEIWDAGAGGAAAGSTRGTVMGIEVPKPAVVDPAGDESKWIVMRFLTGQSRPLLRSGVSTIETAVARFNAALGKKTDPYNLSTIARKAVEMGQATRTASPTDAEVAKDISNGLTGAAKSLGLDPEQVTLIDIIQKAASAPPSTTGGPVKIRLYNGVEREISGADQIAYKTLMEDLTKGMSTIIRILPNERKMAKILHGAEILNMAWLAKELYDAIYVGTTHVPGNFSAKEVATICTASKIRRAAYNEMKKCKTLSEEALAEVTNADQALVELFNTAADKDVTSDEMTELAERYLVISQPS
jgi:hypothetical protein